MSSIVIIVLNLSIKDGKFILLRDRTNGNGVKNILIFSCYPLLTMESASLFLGSLSIKELTLLRRLIREDLPQKENGKLSNTPFKIKKNAKEPMIALSNHKFPKAMDIYRKRWEIETLFSHLKTRGFRREDTHLTCSKRIEKLLFILAIAFCWALKTGELQAKKRPIKIKKHGRTEKSIFRVGFDLI